MSPYRRGLGTTRFIYWTATDENGELLTLYSEGKAPLTAVVLEEYAGVAPPQKARYRLRVKYRSDGRLAFASCG